MTVALLPNAELVGVAWVGQLPGMTPGMVATQLPSDPAGWAVSGFVVVGPVVGGSITPDNPLRVPVLTIGAWAASLNSNKPPYGKACNLAERIVTACFNRTSGLLVQLPGQFPPATIRTVRVLNEPRRVYLDEGAYAHYTMDLSLAWTMVGQVTP